MVRIDTDRGERIRATGDPNRRFYLRQSEIQNFGVPTLSHEEVGRLDIAMNDTLRMRRIERVGNLDRQVQQRLHFHRSRADAVLQRRAFEQFHGDERLPVLLADVMNSADIGMIQCGSCLRLTFEARQSLRVFGHILGKKLQRHEAVQPGVFGLVHHPHAPTAESFEDAVVRKSLAVQRIQGGHVRSILGCANAASQRTPTRCVARTTGLFCWGCRLAAFPLFCGLFRSGKLGLALRARVMLC